MRVRKGVAATPVRSSQPVRLAAPGSIGLYSLLSTVSGTGSVVADGGNAYDQFPRVPNTVMKGGQGGKGSVDGAGGVGGAAGAGPGAAKAGGAINVYGAGGISLANYEANGGSVVGAFDAVAGNGGNDVGGGVPKEGKMTGGGKGGSVGNNGNGGDGGTISLTTIEAGDINVDTLSAIGGSVGDMSGKAGNGGSQLEGGKATGTGGQGGAAGDNGAGGDGGSISISLVFPPFFPDSGGSLDATGTLDVDGGLVGSYSARSGNGGNGGTGGGSGGGAGALGNNGKAGSGNKITIVGSDGAVTFEQSLLADGGSVAAYTGVVGHGGDSKSKKPVKNDVGGGGGQSGTNGAAGASGTINIGSATGEITTQLVSASGGSTSASARQGSAEKGGEGGIRGGAGGTIGMPKNNKEPKKTLPPVGTKGGRGGTIGIVSAYGGITLSGDVEAIGSSGGDVSATAGAGGFGMTKGLEGGDVRAAGDGGIGGTITIKAATMLTVNSTTTKIMADGASGGNQSGTGGKGGDSDGTAGNGGDVNQAGNGGIGGTIGITYKKLTGDLSRVNLTAAGGNAGNQSGTGGAPGAGKGKDPAKAGVVDTTSAKPGKVGTVTINGTPQ